MKRKILLLLLFVGVTASAQTTTPQVKQLAYQITRGISTDSLKVRAIFEWITKNIAYDTELLNNIAKKTTEEYTLSQKSDKVIQRKKAVCMGYSTLFEELCMASGITAYNISGYCKNFIFQTNRLSFTLEHHSWNAVKINNRWYLCDLTWSAGSVNEKGTFSRKQNEEFYLSNGQAFINRHIPFDPIWQLLERPVTMNEFKYAQKHRKLSYFNYTDSLRVYESLNAEQQKLGSDLRSLTFDSSNDEAKLSIGYYYAKKAENNSKRWHELVTSFMNKNTMDSYRRANEEKEQVYQLLTSIEQDMQQARYYYSLISPTSHVSRTALSNIRSADSYLYFVEQNKESMAQYYDTLKKVKY
ncbi:transglutaminase domain-containing protein [Emticicia sp. 17c]|uniref:transglutaminase domain-containing protein n=1 Tax=Emticicia sp. 17c TaxID=3127704 RepID=UPI00301C3258